MKVKSQSEVAQSCLTLSDPMDCSLPGPSIHGVFQARVLERGAIAFSKLPNIAPFKSSFIKKKKKNQGWGDFPGGPVIKTSPSNAEGEGLIPGWAAKIPHALRPKNQNMKQKQNCNKLNKDG